MSEQNMLDHMPAKAKRAMNDRLSLSTFTIEVDVRPTVAFEAKRFSEAEAICRDEGLRSNLSLLKCEDVPICSPNAILDVRLAHPDEVAFFRQAPGAPQSTDDLMLVYLVESDGPEDRQT
jgi:hypothetical protein